MNIHGALAGPPPFHSKPPPVALATPVCFPARPLVPPSPLPPALSLDPHPASTSAPRGLVPIYHPLRYPSNGHQSKAEITIRVCPVDEVDGGVDGKANRTRERKRKGGAQAAGERVRGPSEWLAAGARPVVIAFELEITFRTAKCRFSPLPPLPRINGSPARLAVEMREPVSILSLPPTTFSARVKRKDFRDAARSVSSLFVLFPTSLSQPFVFRAEARDEHELKGEKESDNEAEPAASHPFRRGRRGAGAGVGAKPLSEINPFGAASDGSAGASISQALE